MSPPDLPIIRPTISVAATGWAACAGICAIALAWVAIHGKGDAVTYFAMSGLFVLGVLVALFAIIIRPLITLISRLGDK